MLGVMHVVCAECLLVCALFESRLFSFAAIDPTSTGEEGFEEEYTACEDQGQPVDQGKPPFTLAYLLLYLQIASSTGFTKCIVLYMWRSCRRQSYASLNCFTTPAGAAIRLAPIQPEVSERVLITLLSLDSHFEERKHYGMGAPLWKYFTNVFGKKLFPRKTSKWDYPDRVMFMRKENVFLKGVLMKAKEGENVFEKLWSLYLN